MFLNFFTRVQTRRFTEPLGQTIIHLIKRVERPFQQSQMNMYNLWKEGDGDQKLELVVRDYLEVFREIMRDPCWKGLFDLLFRAIFDDLGNRLVWPACSALAWERIQSNLGSLVPIGFLQLYFDATFMGQNFGIESGYVSSLNLRSNAKLDQLDQQPTSSRGRVWHRAFLTACRNITPFLGESSPVQPPVPTTSLRRGTSLGERQTRQCLAVMQASCTS